jgi:hypothetical protein
MKYLKMLGFTAVAAMAMAALTAGTASATTLEVGGVTKSTSTTISASLKVGTASILRDTFGLWWNSCTVSSAGGLTSSTSGATVTGALSALSFTICEREPVTVHSRGTLHVQWTSGTNGTVSSSGAEVTTGSPFGTLNCKTGTGTHLGSLAGTGSSSAHAVLTINASLSCSGISSKWEAIYTVTSPTGLGVVK